VRAASCKQQGLTEDALNEAIEDFEHSGRLTEKDRAVLRFVALLPDPRQIEAGHYEALRASCSEEEIAELLMFVFLNVGMHRFFGTIDFYPMLDPNGSSITQEESRAIYGVVGGGS
jgi:hypothetical protein